MTQRARSRPLWQLALVAMLGLLGLNALVFAAFTLPRLNRSRRAEERVATLREQLAGERAESERLRQRARAIEANTRDARRFFSETMRPMSEALAADLEAVESAVRASGLSADRRGYSQESVHGAPLLRYAMRLPLSGPRVQTVALLRALERGPRFVVIDRIGVQDDKDVGQARFDVDLSAYYQLNGAAAKPDKRARPAVKTAQQR